MLTITDEVRDALAGIARNLAPGGVAGLVLIATGYQAAGSGQASRISGSTSAATAAWSASPSPVRSSSTRKLGPMCETSNRPAWSRVHLCSAMMPEGYCTGNE